MKAFLISLMSIALAEMGDRTQLLSLVLATRYRKPWPILAGVLLATLASHGAAAVLGARFGAFLRPATLNIAVGISMLAMALWALRPDPPGQETTLRRSGAFLATLVGFFVAEIGDKTQIATLALAAALPNLLAVVAGSTCAMLLANAPVIFLGAAFADRLPLKALRRVSVALFIALGALFILRGVWRQTA